jgi:serine/threonine-protein kinase
MSSTTTHHAEDEPGLEELREESPGGVAGRQAAAFLWSAVRTVVLALLVGVTCVFSMVLGVTVYRSYFAIPAEVEVPAIQGQDIREANQALEALGLRLRIEETRHTGNTPERIVISQDPRPGRKVRKDREVLAVVSLGPELIQVPDLSGRSLREVRVLLSEHRLTLGKVSFTDKAPDKPESVVGQKPQAGQGVRRGTPVDVQINKGAGVATVAVPNLVGQGLSQVGARLEKADLAVGGVVWSVHQDAPRGRILSQAPPGGSEVTPGSAVEFEVSAGASGNRVFLQRRLYLELPAGSDVHQVRVVVTSEAGEDVVYRGTHMAGNTLEFWASGPPGAQVETYLNNRLLSREKL